MNPFDRNLTASKQNLLSSFLTKETTTARDNMIPHQGALCRIIEDSEETCDVVYVIEITIDFGLCHELRFSRQDFDWFQRLFAILDTESRGVVDRDTIKDFVTLRCPIFCRRDDDLRQSREDNSDLHESSPTFDEVWRSVAECSKSPRITDTTNKALDALFLGVEGWMVFCRFIALAQYLEAKRRFSSRHLQQTMRHRNSPRGSELVVVDVPPPEPPAPLSHQQLAEYEQKNKKPLPLPELDLDHSLLAAHDLNKRRTCSLSQYSGNVKISLFGSSFSSNLLPNKASSSSAASKLEFKLTFSKAFPHCNDVSDSTVVRRSLDDIKWLNDTFSSQTVLGGTLCGRILPPFPGSNGKSLSQFQNDDTLLNTSIQSTTGGAIAAAAVGVGLIRDVAKSFWRSNSHHGSGPAAATKPSPSIKMSIPESYYNPNSPSGKARQLERYLNYLLEHPALSTSFPLNTILKASQSGLQAAKQTLEECSRLSKEVKNQTPHLDDGKTLIPFWSSTSSLQPSLSWVRTAAQAAMALKVHGMLETSGLQSASAMLQHASLPSFNPSGRYVDWGDDDEDDSFTASTKSPETHPISDTERTNSFEQGVVSVQSDLHAEVQVPDDGYDLLPLPVPAPERRILTAGACANSSSSSLNNAGLQESREARFHYGTRSLGNRFQVYDDDDSRSAFLGDISVDDHIDKLREVIGSVDNTLSRCLASSGGIGKARRERLALHCEIVQGFDSWEGLRGKFVSQRALLKGISGIEHSNHIYEESDLALIDDVSWQTSLASSAVSAAEIVRSAVRAARTAENAKAAANTAAFAAQSACDGSFTSIDEARAAQTRASIAQGHAFHAAVVEHEAKAVKRRATLALAHDVKCWNVHRKREMLRACIAHARSQHEATRRAVDAWSCLRDGYIGTTVIPSTQTRKTTPPAPVNPAGTADFVGIGTPSFTNAVESFKAFTGLGQESDNESSDEKFFGASSGDGEFANIDPFIGHSGSEAAEDGEPTATIYQDTFSCNHDGNDQAAIVAVEHNILGGTSQEKLLNSANEGSVKSEVVFNGPILTEPDLPIVTASPVPTEEPDLLGSSCQADDFGTKSIPERQKKSSEDEETLSASMQSLVDGLMSWGGQFDTDDVLALPTGMAASIAFEDTLAHGASGSYEDNLGDDGLL